MAHDIFISYSTKDKQAANAICHILEENKLRCWIAPRNIHAGKNYSEQIMYGIKTAKVVVLVFSKNSQESVFVNNEIETAFNNNKSIISYIIDDTIPKDNMEFYLKNKHWLEAYPNYEHLFEKLVADAKRLCKEESASISEEKNLEEKLKNKEDVVDEQNKENSVNESSSSFISKYKLVIIAVIIVLMAVVGMTVFFGSNDSNDSSDSSKILIDYVGVNEDGESYYVYGSFESPDDISDGVIHTDFYDDSGEIIKNKNTKISKIDDNTLCACIVEGGNVDKVSVELKDANGNVLAVTESNNIVK